MIEQPGFMALEVRHSVKRLIGTGREQQCAPISFGIVARLLKSLCSDNLFQRLRPL
jgi:hypothetical protein